MHGRSKYRSAAPQAGIWEGEKHGDLQLHESDLGNPGDDHTPSTRSLGSLRPSASLERRRTAGRLVPETRNNPGQDNKRAGERGVRSGPW